MKTKTFLWALVAGLVVVVLVLAFRPAGGGSGKGGIVNVDAAGVRDAISAGAQVVDVRTPGEFSMGHIETAVNVPVEQVATAAQGWDKSATYVVYCATGARSATAVETMRGMGFNNIKHFSAGVQAWDDKLVQGDAIESQKIETSGKPVMLEFYTDSWPTCVQMKPVVDGLAKEYKGKVDFRLENVSDNGPAVDLANKMGITAVPTFIFVNSNGIQAATKLGGMSEEEFRKQLDSLNWRLTYGLPLTEELWPNGVQLTPFVVWIPLFEGQGV